MIARLGLAEVSSPHVGTLGYLAIFAWSLGMMLLTPRQQLALAAGACLLVAGFLYPRAFRRIFSWRWLLFLSILVLPAAFWLSEPTSSEMSLSLTMSGWRIALVMFLRAIVVLVAVTGFASRVSITEVAGLFERMGLRGLGFWQYKPPG